jgi:DNA-binding CsgD family transcriptional regulator
MTISSSLTYEFRVKGHLDDHWSASLGDLSIIRHDDGTSTLTGPVADQAQLHGVLARLRDIGATLLSLHALEAGVTWDQATASTRRATASVTSALGRSRFESEFKAGQELGRDDAARLALRDDLSPPSQAFQAEGAGVLAQREAEVARLVADGLSNKAIGARLFISERTVESDVRDILNKLGFTSRAQIAAWIATSDR